jgi:hypothetical protein
VGKGEDRSVAIERVAERFGLGPPVGAPRRVAGGLSNELWRLVTGAGAFAVKRMVLNADRPDFVGNVESAYAVERRAWDAGVAVPEPVPVPGTGRALAEVGGALFRVHRWVDGRPGEGDPAAAAKLLATIHAAASPRWEPQDPGWTADRWGKDLGELARRVAPPPGPVLVVDSHRDLDRKNTLLRADGTLVALDWDAAGPVAAVHEAAGLALDWSGGDPVGFARAVRVYTGRGGVPVPADPWIFGGWVAAQGGWLDYHAPRRDEGSCAQVRDTLARLRALGERLDGLLAALRAAR